MGELRVFVRCPKCNGAMTFRTQDVQVFEKTIMHWKCGAWVTLKMHFKKAVSLTWQYLTEKGQVPVREGEYSTEEVI